MDINRLKSDELLWELENRGVHNYPTTRDGRRVLLRQVLNSQTPLKPITDNVSDELVTCSSKLEELIADISKFDVSNKENEYQRINTRLLHIQGRLKVIVPDSVASASKSKHLEESIEMAVELLKDAQFIACIPMPASKAGTVSSGNIENPEEGEHGQSSVHDRPSDPNVTLRSLGYRHSMLDENVPDLPSPVLQPRVEHSIVDEDPLIDLTEDHNASSTSRQRNVPGTIVPKRVAPIDIILGMDILRAYPFTLNLRNSECFLDGKFLSSSHEGCNHLASLVTSEPHLSSLSIGDAVVPTI